MADVLQEFLVSVKYQVDAASENNFLAGLKRAATSVSGVAAELLALSGAVLGFSKILAEAAGNMSYMSQRIGSSVGDITATAQAMALLGVSTATTNASLEALHRFTLEYGPAATQWLRRLGITAKDSAGQYEQLAAILARTAKDPRSQALAFKMAQSILPGITIQEFEQMSRGAVTHGIEEQRSILMHIWGVNSPEALKRETDESAKTGREVIELFQQIGFYFAGFREQLGADLFKELIPKLHEFLRLLHDNTPTIKEFVKHFANFMLTVVDYTVKAALSLERLYKAFEQLDPKTRHMIEIVAGLAFAFSGIGKALLTSPIFRFATVLIMLMGLFDDYQHFKEHKGRSLFDWSGFDRLKTMFDGWVENLTGVKDGFVWLLTGLGALILFGPKIVRLAGFILGIGRAAGVAALGIGTLSTSLLPVLAALVVLAGLWAAGKAEKSLKEEAEAKGYKYNPGDPSIGTGPTFEKDGKTYSGDEVAKSLGHPEGYVTPGEWLSGKHGAPGADPKEQGGYTIWDLLDRIKKGPEAIQREAGVLPPASPTTGYDPAGDLTQAEKDARTATENAVTALGRVMTGDLTLTGDMTVRGDLKVRNLTDLLGGGGGDGGGGDGGGGGGGGGAVASGVAGGSAGGRGGIDAPAGTPITRTGLATVRTANGRTFQVDARFAPNFQGFINAYEKAGGVIGPDSGTLGMRPGNASGHPIGAAIDINQIGRGVRSQRGVSLDPALEDALAKMWGFVSGNSWRSNDQGHFGIESVEAARRALSGGTPLLPGTVAGRTGTGATMPPAGTVANLHQTTTIQVQGCATPEATARAVAGAQGRVNQTLTRGVIDHLR